MITPDTMWSPKHVSWTVSHTRELVPSAAVRRGDRVSPLLRELVDLDDLQVVEGDVTVSLMEALQRSNVDGFIVLRRGTVVLERYLTMVWDAGAVPVVVLNKSDLSDDPEGECAAIRSRLPHVDVVSVSALADDGVGALSPYLQPARTVALLGMSGVGKSTLVNRLVV